MITLDEMLARARAEMDEIAVPEARRMIEADGALLVDVREGEELRRRGIARGAHHVPRGTIEFHADPGSAYYDARFRFDRPIILYCAAGARAVLAGRQLKDMGYSQVYTIGSLSAWIEAGGEVDSWPGDD
jgi:rhodanese-related sulfurtransferase